MQSTLHFTHPHPGHILQKVIDNTEYKCEACKTDGGGTRFQCNNCEYCMHEYCTMCPSSISSFMHPHQPLTLAITRSHRICNICSENIDGLFFFCRYCDNFNAHPLCTLLPQKLIHVLDQTHPLTLQAFGSGGFCIICKGECPPWRYRCTICNLDIHIECVSVPSNNPDPFTNEHRIPPYHRNKLHQGEGSLIGRRYKKKMYAIVGQIAIGVVSSIIFGELFV